MFKSIFVDCYDTVLVETGNAIFVSTEDSVITFDYGGQAWSGRVIFASGLQLLINIDSVPTSDQHPPRLLYTKFN